MMRRVSLLIYIDSKIYKLTNRMHFDQFNTVKKGKNVFLYHPLHFQACPTMHTFKRNLLISQQLFFKYTGLYSFIILLYKRIIFSKRNKKSTVAFSRNLCMCNSTNLSILNFLPSNNENWRKHTIRLMLLHFYITRNPFPIGNIPNLLQILYKSSFSASLS